MVVRGFLVLWVQLDKLGTDSPYSIRLNTALDSLLRPHANFGAHTTSMMPYRGPHGGPFFNTTGPSPGTFFLQQPQSQQLPNLFPGLIQNPGNIRYAPSGNGPPDPNISAPYAFSHVDNGDSIDNENDDACSNEEEDWNHRGGLDAYGSGGEELDVVETNTLVGTGLSVSLSSLNLFTLPYIHGDSDLGHVPFGRTHEVQ